MDLNQLQSLSQRFDIWQLDARPMAGEGLPGQAVSLWMRAVVSRTDDQVLALELSDGEPTLEQVWETLLKAVQKPETGEPHRPTQVQMRDKKWTDPFKARLEAINVQSEVVEVVDQIDEMFGELSSQSVAAGQAGLLS